MAHRQLELLQSLAPSVSISPAGNLGFFLTPGSHVGSISIPDCEILIHPKFEIRNLFFLLSYLMDAKAWKDSGFDFDNASLLTEAMVSPFVLQTKRSIRRGLLQDYQVREETATTLRGRIRFEDQIRRHFGRVPPLEVRYDEYTVDNHLNRVLKAALRRLQNMTLRSADSGTKLRKLLPPFADVTDVGVDPKIVGLPAFTRLTEHYRPAVELAVRILKNSAIEIRHGNVEASALLFDMNDLFEDFVVAALRDSLGLDERRFPQQALGRRVRLDVAGRVKLKPDLSWWQRERCLFVGDAKYKRIAVRGFQHPDLYQMLAYCIATELPWGLLVYAKGETEEVVHETVNLGRTIIVRTLDLTQEPHSILSQIERIAENIRTRSGQGARTAPLIAAMS